MKKTLLSILLAVSAIGSAQMSTDSSTHTPAQLVNDVLLSETSITATNITSSSGISFGTTHSLGYYSQTGLDFPFANGIILATGDITNIPGPNTNTQLGGQWQGDNDLGPATNDATSLEFDFVAPTDHFSLNYIFATKEYSPENCMSSDYFSIVLTDGSGNEINLVTVPGTALTAGSYYSDQCAGFLVYTYGEHFIGEAAATAPINFAGMTMSLTAQAHVMQGDTYHIKIVVADNNDHIFDSALFIQGGSFDNTASSDLPQQSASNGYILCEGSATILSLNGTTAESYLWSTGATSSSIVVNESGTYTVAISSEGVVNTYTFNVMDESSTLINGGYVCTDYETGNTEPYILNTGLDGAYNFLWIYNGMPIPGATGSSFSASEVGVYTVTVTDLVSGCSVTNSATIEESGPALLTVSIDAQTITINAEGYGEYQYQLDNGEAQAGNVFEDTGFGTHNILAIDLNGCGTSILMVEITMPDAPDGASVQNFTSGETLANLEVSGENIQWYASAGSAAGRDVNDNDDLPLPMSTPLEHNTTYYASQTINGVESLERLPVTAHSSLGTEANTLTGLSYYPNPVKDILILSDIQVIEEITIYNLLGQNVYQLANTTNNMRLNLSDLSVGLYIIKITAAGHSETIKIEKK